MSRSLLLLLALRRLRARLFVLNSFNQLLRGAADGHQQRGRVAFIKLNLTQFL
jgi:hypothetical protein